MYAGLSAGILRQAIYTTTRLGIYTWLFKMAYGPSGEPTNSFRKAGMGMANISDALFDISHEEEVLPLWRGAIPTMGRAMVVNAAQLASYPLAKQGLLNTGFFKDNIFLHFCALTISGLVTTAAFKNKNSEYENNRRQTRIQRSLRRFKQTKDSYRSGNNLPHITCAWDLTLFSLSSS
ncbi:Mitochondrial 2-oxoglutarate/malate carrier protein [Armadillidium nasatum]|uniref:Mitochondrial 2-oxoglutarate/malate carrier protein n=1 Tax=Armadillidium nasatum TaxID=96803 RepID=A0A5N5SU79_9CRUS|nr:Mitochondrial 2-oxoglutarate/malate carrier protein [Armadillidium nasatum]